MEELVTIAQMTCLGYSFISFALMVKAGFTAEVMPTDFAGEVIKAFGWPIALIYWLKFEAAKPKYPFVAKMNTVREPYKFTALTERYPGKDIDWVDKVNDQFMFKNGLPKIDPLDFPIEEVIFYVKDENPNVHTDPTVVPNLKGDVI